MQAGLLGCEAVLSSMALMQASTMAAPPKKMMAPLGHAPPQREGPDRAPQSHMILPSGMSCPPLLIRKEGEFQAPRLLDEKDMRTNEDMQQKKKNRKSVTPCKVREQEGRGGKGTGGDENGPASKVQKNFICDHCYGAFRSGYHLKRHILIHTGEKPYACAVCDMRFIQRYHLERHSLIHTGMRPQPYPFYINLTTHVVVHINQGTDADDSFLSVDSNFQQSQPPQSFYLSHYQKTMN
ncbi:hypothetical protein ILYODFUR_000071 [Ilyodon furcidens]|uniref:C2H2-type domain-containing protein n=1 Tax=Ilyodon furcidens TaxID=33524 RepID=A0ABV0UZV2_9TELE